VVPGLNLVLKGALLTDIFRGFPQENIELRLRQSGQEYFYSQTSPGNMTALVSK
jgi:hypothetical protein